MAEHRNKERKPMDVEVVVLEEENEVECIDNKHKEKDDHVHLKENGKGDLHIVKHNKDEGDIGPKECSGSGVEVKVEEKVNNDEDLASDSFEMLVDDSDNEQSSASDYDDKAKNEAPLTDAEVEELVAEFLEIESKAAEAQESLEQESLAQVEREVRSELAESLHGDALELAVSNEMKVLVEEWEDVLDNLETQSALLLEQLDGAGIELPSLYKWIESQVPGGCRTEAWKTRAHWVGSVATSELNQSVKDAEQYLQSCHPVRRKHGRLLESGSSGYLAKNLSVKDGDNLIENSEKDWQIFDEIIHSGRFSDSNSFGSNNWAAVYMASTPQQAANLGLHLPGVNEVEEIGEIEGNPFYDEATQNEKEIGLSEEQKRNYRKVREEDDVKITKKLQCRLKQRRKRKRKYQELVENDVLDGVAQLNESQLIFRDPSSSGADVDHPVAVAEDLKPEIPNKPKNEIPIQNDTIKRSCESEDVELDNKRHRTVIIESDDEVQVIDDKSPSHDLIRDQCLTAQVREVVDVIDSDVLSSPTPANNDSLMDIPEKFHCTACSEVLKASEVQRHPTLEVIVCTKCSLLIEEKMRIEDPDLGVYCRWCGKCDDLIRCKSCKMLFCAMCIARNFGETRFLDVETNGWDCCCCSPVLLHQFISECEKALKGFMVSSSESESELSDGQMVVRLGHKKRRKKRIRRIMDDTELGEETRRKIAMEKARQEHLKSMQAQSVGKFCNTRSNESVGEVSLDDPIEGYIVNIAREKDEEPVRIPQSISAKLKPHQIAGIRFMWENIIQSVKKVKSGDIGLGCILAHTMGLGKTFQVIAFLYTAMRKIDLGLRTALIVTPVNVLHNWRQEFVKWRPTELKSLRVFMLEDVARERRADLLSKWRVKGGIFLIGYAAFRNLSLGRHVKDRSTASEICHALHYVPDILVCDEAHMIKNTRADITQALKQVKTQRRIALTGSPLQNNLMEYYCMVDFVREGYLGSSHEFRNRFQNPIENGQHTNSTIDDVRIMNQRSHILYEQLKGFVQRMDMNVVKKDLPPKTVFVITVKLSPLQRKLYRKFLDVHGFTGDKISSEKTIRPRCFFANYQALAQVWNHPGLLQVAKEHRDYLRREDAVENFLVEDGSSDDNMENDFSNGEKQKAKDDIFYKRNDGVFYHQETDWWTDLLGEKIYQEVDYSGKMVLLLDILTMSSEVGDKVLVFSQSLTTLDLIEMFLSKLPRKESEGKFWKQGKDWYRLDGSTQCSERQKLVERFNEPTNKRVKCTLISTRAGSLGINLYAANRVIVVDGSWNPTYDLQAIYRVWRYGQTKPVYAYRLMAHGTMEEKIYKRQVTKEGLAARVVDRQQIHRTMSKEEILHLFDFGDDENADMLEQDHRNPMTSNHDETNEVGCLGNHECLPFNTADKLMENLLRRHYPRWIANYHEHETLLQENEAERLSKEEQDMAWQTYRRSLEWEEVHRTTLDDGDRVANSNTPPEIIVSQQTKGSSRSRPVKQRKCTNLAHLLTLRSQGIKPGFSTVCGECSQEISWENLNRDGRSR